MEASAFIVCAAAAGDASRVEMLLSQGARVDVREQGLTPLLVAAHRGHVDVCDLLLETRKSNVKETKDGFTPLLARSPRRTYWGV